MIYKPSINNESDEVTNVGRDFVGNYVVLFIQDPWSNMDEHYFFSSLLLKKCTFLIYCIVKVYGLYNRPNELVI